MISSFIRSPDVLTRRILGRTLLIPLRSRVADLQDVLTLNETAEWVWDRLAEATDAAALAGELAREFEVDEEQAGVDVRDLLDDLVRRRYVEPVEP